MPAQVSAVLQCESRYLATDTKDDIKLKSSMNALTKGREPFPEYMKHGAFDNKAYSMMSLIPDRKRILDKVQPGNIRLKCQQLGAEDEKEFRIVCFYERYPVFIDTRPDQCKQNKSMWD